MLVAAVVGSADENAPKLKDGFAEERRNVDEGNYTLRGGTREVHHHDQNLQSLSMLGGAKSGF